MDCSPPGSSVHEDSPGKDTGVGCHALLQGSNLGLLHCRRSLYRLSYQEAPVGALFSRGASQLVAQDHFYHPAAHFCIASSGHWCHGGRVHNFHGSVSLPRGFEMRYQPYSLVTQHSVFDKQRVVHPQGMRSGRPWRSGLKPSWVPLFMSFVSSPEPALANQG